MKDHCFTRLGIAGLVFVSMLGLAGCPAAKACREGKTLDDAGKHYEAAEQYLDALDINGNFKKAAGALGVDAEPAYNEKLGQAKAYEDDKNYPSALVQYRELDKFVTRLQGAHAASFTTINIAAKIDEMSNQAAEQDYVAAEAALKGKNYEDAVNGYLGAARFREGYKDTGVKVGVAYAAWADDDFGRRNYRQAAEHYDKAHESHFAGADAKAGAIYAALGKYFTKQGSCRQAVKDLRAAQNEATNAVEDGDLAAANACAVTPVAILSFENPTGINIAGMALGDTLSDQVGSKVAGGASEFVQLIERSALDQILAEQGLTASGITSGPATKLTGVRYLVVGKLTQVNEQPPPAAVVEKTTNGSIPYPCTKTGSDGKSYQATCDNRVVVAYLEHVKTESLTIVGSLRVVDVKTGQQLAAPTLQTTMSDKVDWADAFSVNGQPVAVVENGRTGGVMVFDNTVLERAQATQTMADEGQLATMALDKLSSDAAKAVLAVVDIERTAPEPTSLAITLPK